MKLQRLKLDWVAPPPSKFIHCLVDRSPELSSEDATCDLFTSSGLPLWKEVIIWVWEMMKTSHPLCWNKFAQTCHHWFPQRGVSTTLVIRLHANWASYGGPEPPVLSSHKIHTGKSQEVSIKWNWNPESCVEWLILKCMWRLNRP